jgi:hypothetical protein
MTDFFKDIGRGKIGEQIFVDDFLNFLKIEYKDVTGCQKYQVIDSDFITGVKTYEIKANYKDNDILIFEDYTNINEGLGKKSLGWVYKTRADLIIFVSVKTRTMIMLPFGNKFKQNYKNIRGKTKLIHNSISCGNGNKWQSAFRKVPFCLLDGYISVYKKL